MERNERMGRTRVTLLEYPADGEAPTRSDFKTSKDLDERILKLESEKSSSVKFRLFVVEDLSRDVIETLGSRYDVDPSFFREHLVDYIWYNISKSMHGYLRRFNPIYIGFSLTFAVGAYCLADQNAQRTGGETRQISTSSRAARIGFRCVFPEPDTSRTQTPSPKATNKPENSTSIACFRAISTTAGSGTPIRRGRAKQRRPESEISGAGRRSG